MKFENNWPVDDTQNHMLIPIYIYVNDKEHLLKIKIILFILLTISNLQLHVNYQSLEQGFSKSTFKGPNLNFHQCQRSGPEQSAITKLVFNKHT